MSELNHTSASAVPPLEQPVAPTDVNYDAVTTYTYPLPHSDGETPKSDAASTIAFTDYMKSRVEPRAAGTKPTIVRYPVEEQAVRKVHDGWYIHPRVAGAVIVGTFALFNAVGNAGSFVADAHEAANSLMYKAKERIAGAFGHKQRPAQSIKTKVPGHTIVIDETLLEPSGKSQPNATDISGLVGQVQHLTAQGDTVTTVTIDGSASAEWGSSAASLSRPDAGNATLAQNRAIVFADALHTSDVKDGRADLPTPVVTSAEDILGQDAITALETEAGKYGLSLDEALAIFNNHPDKLQPGLRDTLQHTIGDKRNVHVHVELKTPDTYKTTPITTTQSHDQAPDNKDHDYHLYWLAVPLLPIPRRRREEYVKQGYKEWRRPGTKGDQRWVELDQEALQPDDTLPDDAWRYTRKYLQLAREDRIDYVLTHRYTDAAGTERELRAMFVDHDPTDATIEAFKRYMNDAAQMQEGKITERLSMITVFPSSQAGINKKYPEHMGLDIDKQDPAGIMGVAAPALGLVEMHMPEDPTDQELYGFDGALHTLTHEVLGHFTDAKHEPVSLTPTGPAAARHYEASNPWADTGAAAFDRFPDVDAKGERHLEVTRQIVTKGGKLVTLTSVVREGDRRLTEAQSTRLLGRKPTHYAGTSAAELYAEVGAQVTTGMEIPYSETDMHVPTVHHDLAQGYGVDPELQQLYESRTDWSRESSRPVNEDDFTLSLAIDDPLLHDYIVSARKNPMPQDRITILTTVRS